MKGKRSEVYLTKEDDHGERAEMDIEMHNPDGPDIGIQDVGGLDSVKERSEACRAEEVDHKKVAIEIQSVGGLDSDNENAVPVPTTLIFGSEEEVKKQHDNMLPGIGKIIEKGMGKDHKGPILYDQILRNIFDYVNSEHYRLSGNPGAEVHYKTKDSKKEVVIKESEREGNISITLIKHGSNSCFGCQETKSVTNYINNSSIIKEKEKGKEMVAKNGNNLNEALRCLMKIYKDQLKDAPGLSPLLGDKKAEQVKTPTMSRVVPS